MRRRRCRACYFLGNLPIARRRFRFAFGLEHFQMLSPLACSMWGVPVGARTYGPEPAAARSEVLSARSGSTGRHGRSDRADHEWEVRALSIKLNVKQRANTVGTLRFVSVFLMETLARWIPTTPEMEVKMLLSRQVWRMAQQADRLGRRGREAACSPAL